MRAPAAVHLAPPREAKERCNTARRVMLVDNYDSFTYNLAQMLAELGADVTVRRNDRISIADVVDIDPTHLVISPGPGVPAASGMTLEFIAAFAGLIPILGVCLGHQAIGEAFGAGLKRAPRPEHGTSWDIEHDGRTVFAGLPQPLQAGRYHSLALERETLPACLEVTAVSADGVVMGIRHRELVVEGVQFHPESVLTPEGATLLGNFLAMEVPSCRS